VQFSLSAVSLSKDDDNFSLLEQVNQVFTIHGHSVSPQLVKAVYRTISKLSTHKYKKTGTLLAVLGNS
jgi:hypothetical protein